MPLTRPLGVALSYVSLAADLLLARNHDSPATVFAGVECLEILSQLSEFESEGLTPAVAAATPAEALALAGDLLSLDGRAELGAVGLRLRQLSQAVT